MRSTNVFDSLAEAEAFVKGVNYVQDIDVETDGPTEGIVVDGKQTYTVDVIVGGEDDDDPA
jgi:hypothetical protein